MKSYGIGSPELVGPDSISSCGSLVGFNIIDTETIHSGSVIQRFGRVGMRGAENGCCQASLDLYTLNAEPGALN